MRGSTGRQWAVFGLASVPLALLLTGWLLAGTAPNVILVLVLALVTSFAGVGALLAVRFPRNPVGWVLYVQGATVATEEVALGYAATGRPGAVWGVWVASWLWMVGLAGILVVLPLTFPDGRLLSRRWRAVLLGAVAGVAGFALGNAFFPEPLFTGDPNPLAWESGAALLEPVRVAGAALFFGATVASAVSAVRRYRRANGIERAQLRWFAAAIVVVVLALMVMGALYESGRADAAQILIATAAIGLPLAIATAIFRYRLYEIDRLISRAVSYALLTGLLAGVYVSAVLLLGRALAPVTPGSELAVAAATLAAAAVFAPARRRIQTAVDRRFNRAHYDARRAVERFRAQLRDSGDLEELSAELLRTTGGTVAPASASVWLHAAEARR